MKHECEACNGDGVVFETCWECEGEGTVEDDPQRPNRQELEAAGQQRLELAG